MLHRTYWSRLSVYDNDDDGWRTTSFLRNLFNRLKFRFSFRFSIVIIMLCVTSTCYITYLSVAVLRPHSVHYERERVRTPCVPLLKCAEKHGNGVAIDRNIEERMGMNGAVKNGLLAFAMSSRSLQVQTTPIRSASLCSVLFVCPMHCIAALDRI